MNRRNNRKASIRAALSPLERLLQANIALVIVQAVIVLLSLELADPGTDEPDVLVLVGFLAACVVAGAIVFALNRIIRQFDRRELRIAIAVGCLVVQAAAFQLLHTYAS